MNQFVNLDSALSVFFARQLESVKARTYDVVQAPLKAFQLFPVDSSAGPGAESIVYRQYDATGIAKIIANYADDLPRVNVSGKEFTARVKSVGNSYGYSLQELRAAQTAGQPLQQRMADAAVRSQREIWNKIAFYGDAANGLPGFLTNTNIPDSSAPADGVGSGTTFASKITTPDKIIRDLNTLANTIVTSTNGAEEPDTLVLPVAQYALLASNPRSSTSDTTILDYFLANNPFIRQVEWANELTAAQMAANGVTRFTGDVAFAYRRSPDVLTLEMPQMFEQFPAQERGLEYVVPCHSRIAGVLVYYPMACRFMDGV